MTFISIKGSIFLRLILLPSVLIWSLSLSAQKLPDEREVRINFSEVPIDSALLLLVKASGVNISYDTQIIPKNVYRTIASDGLKLGLILDDVLFQTGLVYRIVADQLIIKRDPSTFSKKRITVSGYVSDVQSGEKLVYANIFNGDLTNTGTTNEYGYYSITLPQGEQYLNSTYVGYKKAFQFFIADKDTVINIMLEPESLLNEVVILSSLPQASKKAEQVDNIPIELMNGMSSLAGEPDLFRMIQMRAGVTSGADGLGGINVRGGESDQNLILLDGVPIYNTGHALGLFSIFNPSVVKSAQLIKTGFPSKYGGRLSSVLDVRVKEGNKNELHGDISITPILLRGSLEGPIKKGKSSFLISGRRTIVDPWLKPLSKYQFELNNEKGFVNYFFYDLNAKVNFILGDKDELYLSGYAGKDKFENEVLGEVLGKTPEENIEELDVTGWDWGNRMVSLRWGHYFNQKLVSYVQLGYSKFIFENFNFDRSILQKGTTQQSLLYNASFFGSDIADILGSIDFEYFATSQLKIKAGVNLTQHQLRPGVSYNSTRDQVLDENNRIDEGRIKELTEFILYKGSENRFYVDNEIVTGPLVINAGLHFSLIQTEGKSYNFLQPRLSFKAFLSEKNIIKLSYSQMDQYLHLLSSSGFGLPNDVWVSSSDIIAPQQSKEVSLGIYNNLGDKGGFNISAYYKNFQNLRALSEGGFLNFQNNNNWEEEVPIGKGRTYGVELEVEKRTGALKGWLNYTFAKSLRQYDAINNGEEFEAKNDRRHSFKINALYQLNTNLEISAGWQIASGLPYTSPVGLNKVIVDGVPEYIEIYSTINNINLKTYHKLDFSLNLYSKYEWGQQKLSIGAYNAYNRQNPFYIDIVRDQETQNFQREAVSIMPLIPFVSVGIAF